MDGSGDAGVRGRGDAGVRGVVTLVSGGGGRGCGGGGWRGGRGVALVSGGVLHAFLPCSGGTNWAACGWPFAVNRLHSHPDKENPP